mmetsp:Transcript_13653/g.25602  ORF Transcript_13653/g.25602 Transcript_13653/m.25602 type:complete len:418 (-) Transcript_13653:849-2102(-)
MVVVEGWQVVVAPCRPLPHQVVHLSMESLVPLERSLEDRICVGPVVVQEGVDAGGTDIIVTFSTTSIVLGIVVVVSIGGGARGLKQGREFRALPHRDGPVGRAVQELDRRKDVADGSVRCFVLLRLHLLLRIALCFRLARIVRPLFHLFCGTRSVRSSFVRLQALLQNVGGTVPLHSLAVLPSVKNRRDQVLVQSVLVERLAHSYQVVRARDGNEALDAGRLGPSGGGGARGGEGARGEVVRCGPFRDLGVQFPPQGGVQFYQTPYKNHAASQVRPCALAHQHHLIPIPPKVPNVLQRPLYASIDVVDHPVHSGVRKVAVVGYDDYEAKGSECSCQECSPHFIADDPGASGQEYDHGLERLLTAGGISAAGMVYGGIAAVNIGKVPAAPSLLPPPITHHPPVARYPVVPPEPNKRGQ